MSAPPRRRHRAGDLLARRWGRRAAAVSVCLTTVVGAGVVSAAAGAPAGAVREGSSPFPGGTVYIDGHGLGPGFGMGQWGAFGYAAVEHETYQWILAHFYGGTALTTTPDPEISVGIIENEGVSLVVTSPAHFRLGGVKIPAGDAARAALDAATGRWTVSQASSCAGAGGWHVVATGVADPRAVPASQHANAPAADLLTICRGDGTEQTVRGLVEARVNSSGGQDVAETVNLLPLDEYVADVVPSESSSGWGEVGGSGPQSQQWGFQELEAQAVAARTYTLAYIAGGGWGGYADICDSDYCQTYPGITNESAVATAAAVDTSGQYLTLDGAPAPTQYSASTGGWTVPSQFPAVADAGDSVCISSSYWTCNPDHDWQVTVPVKTVEATFPSIGTLEAIRVIARNGLGEWGGRALSIRIRGAAGTVVESGDTFQYQFGLDSNWILIAHPAASASAPLSQADEANAHGGVTTGPAPSAGASGTGPLPAGRGSAPLVRRSTTTAGAGRILKSSR
jgi:SpoIID/LytB domain protein